MTILAGSRLGPFEIVAALGVGGMGEVYRAKDTKLGREVAIKVLPEEVSADSERVQRFEREARSASALNHPNIITIHDAGTTDGVSWIAMELVEGQTLRQLVAGDPLPTKKLLGIAPQIAEGLAAAHEVGIVHRDLKPENVMVTKDGRVKILDFGLAKLTGAISGSGEHSNLPTVTGTSPGVMLGTVGYMSPEQAAGHSVDFRSDQFSFGSILYELATGKRAFQKKTAVDTLSAILNEEPEPIASVNPQTPAPLRWLAERCLAKEPRERFASTEDLARDLAGLRDHMSEATSTAHSLAPSKRVRARHLLIGLAVLTLLAAGLLGGRWISGPSSPAGLPQFRQLTFRSGNINTARFAPDGKTVAYGASWDGAVGEIYTVRTDSVASLRIGIERADVLSVSSRNELAILLKKDLAYGPGGTGTLARVPLAGGAPRELLDLVETADWAPNGEDLAVVRIVDGRRRLEYPIGNVLLEDLPPINIRVSPNGDLVALSHSDTIETVDRQKNRRVVTAGLSNTYYFGWVEGGKEIVFSGGRTPGERAIYSVSLSGRTRVRMTNAFGLALHDVAPDGRLLVEDWREHVGIAFLRRGEARERDLGMNGSFAGAIAPDGQFVIFAPELGPGGLYLQKTDGTSPVRLGDGNFQGLSRDGRSLLMLERGPKAQLTLLPIGAGEATHVPIEQFDPVAAEPLANGNGFLVVGSDLTVGVLAARGGRPRVVPVDGLASDKHGFSSPDGNRFAYVTGDRHVRTVSLPEGVSTTVPGQPLDEIEDLVGWSSDGRAVLVSRNGHIPLRIDRLDLSTGRRDLWRQLMPENPAGLKQISNVVIAADGQSYAYTYLRGQVDDLYVIDGVKSP